jgi:hypothetical protein
MKAQVDSSSRIQKDFICREERRKAVWEGMQGDLETGGSMGWVGELGFIAFLSIAWGHQCLLGAEDVSWKGEVSWPLITFWNLLQSVLRWHSHDYTKLRVILISVKNLLDVNFLLHPQIWFHYDLSECTESTIL